MPPRIVSLLCHPTDSSKGGNKRKKCTISNDVFAKANVAGSDFQRYWKAYKATRPSDEDLKALFEIGRFHEWEGKRGSRLTADHIEARAAFVQEVIERGQSAVKPSQLANYDGVKVCMFISLSIHLSYALYIYLSVYVYVSVHVCICVHILFY